MRHFRTRSPEGYEAEDAVGFSTSGGVSSNGNAKLDTNTSPNENNSSSKKFRRARRPVGSGIGARGPHGGVIGTGTAAKRPPILSREGDAGLSFVFAGENDASESPANREAMHVSFIGMKLGLESCLGNLWLNLVKDGMQS